MANDYRYDGGNVPIPPAGNANAGAPGMRADARRPAYPPAPVQPVCRKKRGPGFWVGLAIALVAIVAAIILCVFVLGVDQPGKRAGTLGQLEGKSQEEIVAELNRAVEDGMFNISISSNVDFADGTSEGNLRIENVPGNRYLMQVDITRDDTGEVIYSSGLLEPNYHIQKDKLSQDLDAGTYSCTATFHALDPETEDEVGTAAAKMIINVLG